MNSVVNRKLKMCRYCSKHKRKKWYLDEDNYLEHLLKDKKRQNVLQKLAGYSHEYELRNFTELLYNTKKTPLISHAVKFLANKLIKDEYAGQIVTKEDALQIVELADNHVLFECACRKIIGDKKEYVCLNFGPMRDLIKKANPNEKIIEIDTYEAKKIIEKCDEEGYFHEIYFAKTPFPVTLCNCEKRYCIGLKDRFVYGVKNALLKGHEVAIVDDRKCNGCFACVQRCQFDAIRIDRNKIVIDPTKCFGCGLCVNSCPKSAILLLNRNTIPEARGIW